MDPDFTRDIQALSNHYNGLVKRHGAAPEGAQYSDRETQERRMAVLCEIGIAKHSRILDFGCGTGQLLSFLQRSIDFEGQYVGYDISPEAIAVAQSTHPAGRFEVRNVLDQAAEERFDYVVVNGVFNNLISDNRAFFEAISRRLMQQADVGYAFNMLSRFVDYFDDGLYYEDPLHAFRFCKEQLSPLVTLRHDYAVRPGTLPFEFAIYVQRSEVTPRPLQG
jgi:SAM-dependent methyltransferase